METRTITQVFTIRVGLMCGSLIVGGEEMHCHLNNSINTIFGWPLLRFYASNIGYWKICNQEKICDLFC